MAQRIRRSSLDGHGPHRLPQLHASDAGAGRHNQPGNYHSHQSPTRL